MIIVLAAILIPTMLQGAPAKKKIPKVPDIDDFYEKTRLIMLKSEMKIYKHLPDKKAREKFIEEFWKKRDPTPGTEENENREAYEDRLDYVERWFKEKSGGGRGWDSDRGKVYLLLGPPDERDTTQGTIIDRFRQKKRVLMEVWIYNHLRVYLRFIDKDELGVYRLEQWPMELLSAIDRAKFVIRQNEGTDQNLTFKAKYKKNAIRISIPTEKIRFDEGKNDDKMNARFDITVYIYRNYKKLDEIKLTRELNEEKDVLLSQKRIELEVPYTPTGKGKYYFDIVVKDLLSGSGYRSTISYKK
jgi:GWxTD domain-containing protein